MCRLLSHLNLELGNMIRRYFYFHGDTAAIVDPVGRFWACVPQYPSKELREEELWSQPMTGLETSPGKVGPINPRAASRSPVPSSSRTTPIGRGAVAGGAPAYPIDRQSYAPSRLSRLSSTRLRIEPSESSDWEMREREPQRKSPRIKEPRNQIDRANEFKDRERKKDR
eukprot:TCALIF_03192-PA protein Name:"Protein of unknown function" AED:0.66 eAED:0.66 QI:0/0/0/0.5/0.66/0.75/4/0/168